MTVNTQQLLASVVSKPKLSSVDGKFMSAIWDAFVTWMTEQLHSKRPVRCGELGDFVLRKDTIGPMEFFNPMFIMNEGFAHRHGLHDRRPKPAALGSATSGRPDDLDIGSITQMATDRLGEVVLRETVENTIKDVIERIGEFCSDDRAHGIVTVDLLFGKLVCENRSVEFHFLSTSERERALDKKKRALAARSLSHGAGSDLASIAAGAGDAPRPSTGAGRPPTGQVRPGTAMSSASFRRPSDEQFGIVGSSATERPGSQSGRLPDPPLQRPKRAHVRKPQRVDARDMLLSHAAQISRKAEDLRREKDTEASQFTSDVQRLRAEMESELEDKVQRRMHMRDVALIHQVQAHEKALRDREARNVEGTTYFPFRTEEEVKAQARRSNAMLKANLDQQMRERAAARASLEALRASRPNTPASSTSLAVPAALKEGAEEQAAHTTDLDGRPHVALQAAIDEAYNRYSNFLESRAGAEARSREFMREQASLSEQAELLKREEQRRRQSEMGAYLKKQMEQKELREKQVKLERQAYKVPDTLPALPPPPRRDLGRELRARENLRATLDEQVEAKRRTKRAEAEDDLASQAEMLALVSHELRENRVRAMARREQQQTVLREAWDKQKALKQLEKEVDAS